MIFQDLGMICLRDKNRKMVDQFTVNLTAEEVSWILCRVAIGESGQVSRATARTGRDCRRGEFAAGQALQGSQKAVGSRAGSSHRLESRLVLGCIDTSDSESGAFFSIFRNLQESHTFAPLQFKFLRYFTIFR